MGNTQELLSDEERAIQELYNTSCRYISRFKERWNRLIYFSPQADVRLGSVLGYILGLYQSGDDNLKQLAIRLLSDFTTGLDNLCRKGQTREILLPKLAGSDPTKVSVEVPASKILLYDDCFHSFSFLALHPVPIDSKSEHIIDFAFNNKDWDYQIYEEPFLKDRPNPRINYARSYNGGFIYHGPGGGENFTVSLARHRFWESHT